jgi:hypothetical protein
MAVMPDFGTVDFSIVIGLKHRQILAVDERPSNSAGKTKKDLSNGARPLLLGPSGFGY